MGTHNLEQRGTWELADTADLRRKQERDLIEVLLARAENLPRDDRELLTAHFGQGRRAADLAALLGVRSQEIRRRLRRLVRRVLSRPFVFVLRAMEGWTPARRRIATALFLHGLPLREAAAAAGASLHEIRRERDAVLALLAEADRAEGREPAGPHERPTWRGLGREKRPRRRPRRAQRRRRPPRRATWRA